jgi:tripartite-type tricarboxylate transporter receptor subunit TctC
MGVTVRACVALFVLAIVAAGPSIAQSYPTKPIRLIVPFPPGGINDTVARPFADRMKAALGQVVIENLSGAGGVIGGGAVARAAADGYTMLIGSAGTHLVGPLIMSNPPYHPLKDFRSIAILAIGGNAITVHPSLPVKTLKELVAYANTPGRALSYGSPGAGSSGHLAAELFKSLAPTPDLSHVSYRGGPAALADLMGGHVPVVVSNLSGQLFELHRAGKIRVLAITTANRSPVAPDIPTARETMQGMIAHNFFGLFVPARTPAPLIERIVAAVHTTLADSAVLELWAKAGLEASPDQTPDKAQRFVEDEINRWSPVIKSLGLKQD